ncbi:MAG: GvpL/GvpF family gas vesicle protein [Proteobacteria bacterium]|nr:GvpL/GvpF family gas vesicle protein [Pseudomonadota bacterium]
MEKEGKYIYCIIETMQERNFGPIGIGGRGDEVLTIGYGDLSMVVSNHPVTKFVVSRENLLAHEKVIEEVMKEFESILPVRFGTVAPSADEIRNLLDRRNSEFRNLLKDMNNKVELGIKGVWKNMEIIFREIAVEDKDIEHVKRKMGRSKDQKDRKTTIDIGRMVEKALQKKKEAEAETIVNVLRKASIDYRLNRTVLEEMFINAAFLIDRGREKEFDNILEDLGGRYYDRTEFRYTGPFPVFNFLNIVIYPEEWEK